jgi:hypothetical protein
MAAMPREIVQEYEVPPDVTAICINAESGGSGRHNSTNITLQVRPGDIVRLRLACLAHDGKHQAQPRDHR